MEQQEHTVEPTIYRYLDERFGNVELRLATLSETVNELRGAMSEQSIASASKRSEVDGRISALEKETLSLNNRVTKHGLEIDELRHSRNSKIVGWLGIVGRLALAAVVAWALAKLSGGAL